MFARRVVGVLNGSRRYTVDSKPKEAPVYHTYDDLFEKVDDHNLVLDVQMDKDVFISNMKGVFDRVKATLEKGEVLYCMPVALMKRVMVSNEEPEQQRFSIMGLRSILKAFKLDDSLDVELKYKQLIGHYRVAEERYALDDDVLSDEIFLKF